jgi:hypothetical protein
MLKWRNIETNKYGEIIAQAGNIRYLVGFSKQENCWCVNITDGNRFNKSLWLTKNSLAIDLDYNDGLISSKHLFATKEEAIIVVERHYRLLILQ